MGKHSCRALRPVAAITTTVVLALAFTLSSKADDGIFATFQTSMGEFKADLAFEKAPATVANFIGLVEGTQPFIDRKTGRVRRGGFYDGILFHRVIDEFVIQAGSPAGDGTDGPGYTFRDEFDPSLRHDGPYVLSMANSGPNTNGSQFFVTLAATPHLDDLHSVFGFVTAGSDVVKAIGKVDTDAGNRPEEAVVIESLTIERVGSAADAFDATARGLPRVAEVAASVSAEDTEIVLGFERLPFSDYTLFRSPDLRAWTPEPIAYYSDQPPSGGFPAAELQPGENPPEYFRLTEVAYAEPYFTPGALHNHTLTLEIIGGSNTVIYRFDDTDGGSAHLNDLEPGTITQYVYTPLSPYQFELSIISTKVVAFRLTLNLRDENEGTFRGSILSSGQPVSGDFTLTGDP